MTVRVGALRLGLARALVLVGLLAGVFAMHGLTGQHDAAMALRHTMAGEAPGAAHHVEASASMAGELPEADITRGDSGHHHAADLCLAVLTGLALLLLSLIASRRWTFALDHDAGKRPARTLPPDRPPPWAQPSLSKLCVLRT